MTMLHPLEVRRRLWHARQQVNPVRAAAFAAVGIDASEERQEEVAGRLAANVRARQQRAGLFHDDMAALLGITQSSWRKYLSGDRKIPAALLPALAQVFDCEVGELFL